MTGRLNIWLLLLVLVCGLSLWFGRDLILDDRQQTATPVEEKSPADYTLETQETPIHLVVLNGTEQAGLAREVSLLLGRASCVAERVGNASDRQVSASFLVNRRLSDRAAGELARRLGGIQVLREWDGRGSEDAVLVLGADWSQLTASLAKVRRIPG